MVKLLIHKILMLTLIIMCIKYLDLLIELYFIYIWIKKNKKAQKLIL